MNIQRLERLIRLLLDGKIEGFGIEEFDEEDEDFETENSVDGRRSDITPQTHSGTKSKVLVIWLLTVLAPFSIYAIPHAFRTSGDIEWEAGSTAMCRDSTFSDSHHRSGTCSWHHGVAAWRYPSTDTIWK